MTNLTDEELIAYLAAFNDQLEALQTDRAKDRAKIAKLTTRLDEAEALLRTVADFTASNCEWIKSRERWMNEKLCAAADKAIVKAEASRPPNPSRVIASLTKYDYNTEKLVSDFVKHDESEKLVSQFATDCESDTDRLIRQHEEGFESNDWVPGGEGIG